MLDVASEGLQAEMALVQRRFDDAVAHQGKVIAAAEKLDQREPPMLGAGTGLALGRIQSQAGRWAAAEATFREELATRPASGWALRGLARALEERIGRLPWGLKLSRHKCSSPPMVGTRPSPGSATCFHEARRSALRCKLTCHCHPTSEIASFSNFCRKDIPARPRSGTVN